MFSRTRFHLHLFYVFAFHLRAFHIRKDIFILYYTTIICYVRIRNTKVIVIPFSFFMYIHHPAREVWALSCLTFLFPLSIPQYPFIFFFPLSGFFICALAASFGGALCSMTRRARMAVHRKSDFPPRADLKRSVDIARLLV